MTTDSADGTPSADLFPEIGQSLFGPEWIAPLAGALGVSERTVRRWAGDPGAIPRGVWGDLARMLRFEIDRLGDLRVSAASIALGD